MPTITDDEFGEITLRRSAKASHVRIRIAPDGRLRASLPLYAPVFLVKRLVKTSRAQLRALIAEHQSGDSYDNGDQIGKSHTLIIRPVTSSAINVTHSGQQITVMLPDGKTLNDPDVARAVRKKIGEALRIEAKHYLPKRLAFLADKHGFDYDKVRFSHASGRWGSCSSNGTISLNIALMKLPFELIDYVLVHELSHTVHMNHSETFWELVGLHDPDYKSHRRALKAETPSI
jgi:predicted metal-dependent hydrolase